MKKILLFLLGMPAFYFAHAQLLSWSPQFPNDNATIVLTMDATQGNQGLNNYVGGVYMHFGVITNLSVNSSDWKYVPTTWGTTTAPEATYLGNNKWTYTITNPRAYFNVPAGETILRIALLFRNGSGSQAQRNANGSDLYVPIFAAGTNGIQVTQPFIVPYYNIVNEAVNTTLGQQVPLAAVASTTAGNLKMYLNGNLISGPVSSTASITANPTITTGGTQEVVAELSIGGNSYYDTVQFYVTPVNVILPLPAGVREGINYSNDCGSATLVLYAPSKGSAMIIGDFAGSNWQPQSQYQMNKTPDGNYYWLTVNGLTPGTEYAYQYLVDNIIYIADPYAEKVLDPNNDQYIPAATYPNLKPYPTNTNVTSSKNGIVGILQSCAEAYNWQVNDFVKPDKKNLITYELLVRDFGAAKNYQMLIDTISYFKRLGINAIELMPVNEFAGNESWGYNPTFYCALDKAYGTKNKFKEFIDLCHKNGIAVILDVVYNHLDAYSTPQGKLYWDAANGRPAANSPWFNQSAPHPYSVFEDLNHTTTATQYLVERALEYWLKEYKVDGYRLDLAKGFTQTVTNTSTVENYDASRVANLKRYYDYITPLYPSSYMILEFLGTQRQEEQEYANYGFLLWGNNNISYNQNTMGFASNSDISKIVYNSPQQAFTTPAEMGYMESHDEERLMFRNLSYGNSSGSYSTATLATALQRQAAAASLFFTVPGPKMLWQFGERGYDISINFGGSNVSNKPPHWEYMADADRLNLWNAYSKLINLRVSNPAVFSSTSFTYDFSDNGGLFKRFQIEDPAVNGLKITVIANFDVVSQSRLVNFQTTGNWYNYLSNGTSSDLNGPTGTSYNVGFTSQYISLLPGEYHVYIYQPSNVYTFIGTGNWSNPANWINNIVPPVLLPAGAEINITPQSAGECVVDVAQTISTGAKINIRSGRNLRLLSNLIIQ